MEAVTRSRINAELRQAVRDALAALGDSRAVL